MELFQLHIREHADIHRVLHVDAGADAACDIDVLDGFHGHIHALQQCCDGGEDRALGTDEVVNVHFIDGHFPAGLAFVFKGNNVAAHAVMIPADALALPDEQALGVDDAAAVQLGNDVDDAAAADADGLLSFVAHDGNGGFHGHFVYGAGFDGAVRGAHTAGNVAALKGGAGGTGAAHKEVPVAEDDLAVGAKVDEQAQRVAVPDAGGQRTGGDVAAHVGTDVGGDEYRREGVGGNLQVLRQQSVPEEEAGDVRVHADALGIHAHQQVVHGGIRAHTHAQNGRACDPRGLAQIGNDGVQGLLQDGVLKLFPAAGLALLDDTVDDVRAVADLAVAGGALRQNLACGQIGQYHGDRGGADIDGTADDIGVLRGADLHAAEGIAQKFALHAHVEAVFPQNVGQLHHDAEGNLHLLYAQRFLKRPCQALVVGHGVVQTWLGHGHDHRPELIGKVNAALFQLALAGVKNGDLLWAAQIGGLHPGLVGAGDVRNKHGAVADDLRAAAQAPAFGIFFVGNMAAGVGFQFSLHQLDAALAAGAVAGAGSVDCHIGTASQLQKVIADVAIDGNGLAAFDLKYDFWHKDNTFLFGRGPAIRQKIAETPGRNDSAA